MDWRHIMLLALSVFAAQLALGLATGLLAPADAGAAWVAGGHLASLLLCGMVAIGFASRQPRRPFAHASAALLVHLAIGVVFAKALAPWMGSPPPTVIAIEVLLTALALLGGTGMVVAWRQRGR